MNAFLTGFFVVCSFACLNVEAQGGHGGHTHMVASHDDSYRITLHVYSGNDNEANWTLPKDSVAEPEREAKIMKLLDLVGHGQDNKQVKTGGVLADKMGYQGMTIHHYDAKGNLRHNFTLSRCESPVLEWNLVIKTAPTKLVSMSKKLEVHNAIQECPKEGTAKTAETPIV